MIRSYKSWSGLAVINSLGMIAAFGLIITLARGFLVSPDLTSFLVIVLITFVAGVAYASFTALQLRKRRREIYIRKLLGAKDIQVMLQLISESVVLVTFLVVSGLVLSELFAPVCENLFGLRFPITVLSFGAQILLVTSLVLPVGVIAAVLPIKGFINYINNYLSKPTSRT